MKSFEEWYKDLPDEEKWEWMHEVNAPLVYRAGITEGIAEGRRLERGRMMKFAEWM